jgi:DNA-binding NarL/FixJ family response regulator
MLHDAAMESPLNALSMILSAEELETLRTADALSTKERAIFVMIGRGLAPKGIAYELAMSVKTVETHIVRIRRKLGSAEKAMAMGDLMFLARIWVRAIEGAR